MFISVNNEILNENRITTVEVDRDTPKEINYLYKDNGYYKEKLATHVAAQKRLKEVAACGLFIETNDERLVNILYIRSIEQDIINPKRMIFNLYNGIPIKTLYSSKQEATKMVKDMRAKLAAMLHNHGGGSGGGITPSTGGGLIQSASKDDFPTVGDEDCLYLDKSSNKLYFWNGTEYITASSGGSSTLEKNITSNVVIGAAPAGTLFPEGQTFTEFVEKIARKDITPTINTSFSNAGLKEIGTTVNGSLMSLNITNESSVTVPINQIRFYNGNNLLKTIDYVKGKSDYNFTYNQAITTNTTLKAELVYNGGTKINGTGKFEFVYASYYGATALSTMNSTQATALATLFTKNVKNTKALTWENITLNDERFCYMYPKSFGTLISIKDGNGFSQLEGYTKLEVNLTSPMNGDIVPYYVYLLTDATTGTNFKQIYG